MRLEDFDVGVPNAQDGRKLRYLWAKDQLEEAQRSTWLLYVKIATALLAGLAALAPIWTSLHGKGG